MEYLRILVIPLFLLGVGLAIIRFRKLDLVEDVGFRVPVLKLALVWIVAFVAWVFLQELVSSVSGDGSESWVGKYDSTQVAVRIVAVGLVYPIIEEFFFRGVFFGVLRRRLGTIVAVLIPALVFGLIHTQYDWPVWIVLDGIFFALCRLHTRSVYVPMLLHSLGNSYAVWERLQ